MQVVKVESESPVELVRRLFESVLNARDADAMMQYWADDLVEEFPVGTFRGKAEMRDYFASVFAAMPDFHIEATHIIGEGDVVFVAWRATGTFTGRKWMGIEPTGTGIVLDGCDRFTIRNGKVVHNFVLYDQVSFARQIGMLPQAGSVGDKAMLAAFNAQTRVKRALRRG